MTPGESNHDDTLTIDQGLEVLNNPRRRYVLHLLEQNPDGLSIGELADRVGAWEQDTSVDELTKQQRKRVYVSLYQTHVVKMDDLDVVDFDRDAGLVTLTPRATEILRFLPTPGSRHPWLSYYLGYAAVGLLVYLATLWDVAVFASVPLEFLTVAIYLGFTTLVLLHYYDARSASPSFADLVEEDR